MERDDELFAMEGDGLSEDQVRELEEALGRDPGLIDARLQLLGYTTIRRSREPHLRAKHSEHALWFIEHAPASRIAGCPLCEIDRDEPGYHEASAAWERAVMGDDPEVVYNASRFFSLSDTDRARALLELGKSLAPSWPLWDEDLGTLLFREVALWQGDVELDWTPELSADDARALAVRALEHFEAALAKEPSPRRRFGLLRHCAEAALAAGMNRKAARHADEVLALEPQCLDERHRPDYVHLARIIRGHVALDAGDPDGACRELAAAGAQGSFEAPVLRSFGPDFRLAQRLLARQRTEEVVAYLERCRSFWHPARISRWLAQIERGVEPLMHTHFDPNEHGA